MASSLHGLCRQTGEEGPSSHPNQTTVQRDGRYLASFPDFYRLHAAFHTASWEISLGTRVVGLGDKPGNEGSRPGR